MSIQRRERFIASPWDQPKLVREIAIRIMAADRAEQLLRVGAERFAADDEHMLAWASQTLYGDPPNIPMRDRYARVEGMRAAWSIYEMLKARGVIGDEFDKEVG